MNHQYKMYSVGNIVNNYMCQLVVSDALQPHGLQSTRLLCPWNPPGTNTGVGSHFFLQGNFQTQGLNSGLLHCMQILQLSNIFWVTYHIQTYHGDHFEGYGKKFTMLWNIMNQRSVVGQLNSKSKQIHGKQDLIVITKARGGEKELDVSSQKVLQKKHTHK